MVHYMQNSINPYCPDGQFCICWILLIFLFSIIAITTKTASAAQKRLESVFVLRPVLGYAMESQNGVQRGDLVQPQGWRLHKLCLTIK